MFPRSFLQRHQPFPPIYFLPPPFPPKEHSSIHVMEKTKFRSKCGFKIQLDIMCQDSNASCIVFGKYSPVNPLQTSMNSWINPCEMALQCPYWLVLAQCVEGHQTLDCPLVSICFVFLLRHKFVFFVFFPKTVLSRLSETHSQTMTHGPIQVGKMVKTNSESLYFSKQAGSGKVEVSLNLICT